MSGVPRAHALGHLDDALSGFQRRMDFVEGRADCVPQGIIADISKTYPDDLGSGLFTHCMRDKVFVLRDQNRGALLRVLPNGDIIGGAQADPIDVLCHKAKFPQANRKAWGKLGIDDEAHCQAVWTTRWSAAWAA